MNSIEETEPTQGDHNIPKKKQTGQAQLTKNSFLVNYNIRGV